MQTGQAGYKPDRKLVSGSERINQK